MINDDMNPMYYQVRDHPFVKNAHIDTRPDIIEYCGRRSVAMEFPGMQVGEYYVPFNCRLLTYLHDPVMKSSGYNLSHSY